jgi:protein transport protein SEC24
MIVSDLDDIYVPLPYDLLAPLTDCRAVIESLLLKLPALHSKTREVKNILGKAIQFAYKLIVILFVQSLIE